MEAASTGLGFTALSDRRSSKSSAVSSSPVAGHCQCFDITVDIIIYTVIKFVVDIVVKIGVDRAVDIVTRWIQ